jgi:hypothetical protein
MAANLFSKVLHRQTATPCRPHNRRLAKGTRCRHKPNSAAERFEPLENLPIPPFPALASQMVPFQQNFIRLLSQEVPQPMCQKTNLTARKVFNTADVRLRPSGFEPLTYRLEGGCSIQLSYGRVM